MLRMLTAGESHGKALVAILEGLAGRRGHRPEGDRRGARATPARLRTWRPAAIRGGPVRDPDGCAPREEPRRSGGDHDPERRVRGEVRGPHVGRGRGGSRRASDPSTTGARGPGGRAEVRVRRRAQRPGARQRAGDRRARRGRRLLQGVPGRVRDRRALPRGADRLREGAGSIGGAGARGPGRDRRITRPMHGRDGGGQDGRRDRSHPPVEGHRGWRVRGGGIRSASGTRLVRALRPQAGRTSRARPHEHPIGERGRGGGWVRVGGEDRIQGARRDRAHAGPHRPQDRSCGRHRGRDVHRPADPSACRHEAVLDRAPSARHRGPGDGHGREAIKQRTDVCAVPAGGVVGEAVVAFELANAVLEKFGGDSLGETRRNMEAYVETLA